MTFATVLTSWSSKASVVLTHRLSVLTVNLAVLVLVSYSLAQWTWKVARPAETARAPAPPPAAEFDIKQLQAANLFGVMTSLPSPGAAGVYGQIPRTSLNLVLTGVVVLGAYSYGLISADGGPETPYGIGQSILSGVVLEAVQPERVIILRSGAREAVYLKDLTESLPSGSISRGDAVRSTGQTSAVVDRGLMQQQLQKPEFLSQALIVPNPGGGFQVREIQPGSLYEKLGLRVGDVIRSVNGQTVNNMDEVMRMYQQFGNSSQINVEVTRAGQSEILHYDIQ
jgi:general secretion pathway protein C